MANMPFAKSNMPSAKELTYGVKPCFIGYAAVRDAYEAPR